MKENPAVYTALRENILQKERVYIDLTMNMYITYFALLAAGVFWSSWLSLISFLVLIVFQSLINSNQWSIAKASFYIRKFFEEGNTDIHWESLHADDSYHERYTSFTRNIGWYICKLGASFLSVISFSSILFSNLIGANWDFTSLSPIVVVQLCLAFVLCLLTIYIDVIYLRMRSNPKFCDKRIAEIIDKYYSQVHPNQEESPLSQ